jgi:hypothetical protein
MAVAIAVPEKADVIFRPFITLKNGKRLYAWQYGLKAFMIRIRKKK